MHFFHNFCFAKLVCCDKIMLKKTFKISVSEAIHSIMLRDMCNTIKTLLTGNLITMVMKIYFYLQQVNENLNFELYIHNILKSARGITLL